MARGDLADTFRCPSCQGILRENPGALSCTGCGEQYPVRDGVAIFAEGRIGPAEHRQREIFSNICQTTFGGFRSHGEYAPRAIQNWKKLRYLRRMGCTRDAVVVDVGCSEGFYARLLRERYGARVIGVDISDSIFVAARQDTILGLGNRYCLALADRLPLPERFADCVVCFDLLEHLPKPEAAVVEFVRILRPGGRLLIHMPVSDYAYTLQWFLAMCFPRWTRAQAEAIGHFYDQIITSGRLLEIVHALPLRVLRAEKFGGWVQPLHDWFLVAGLGKASQAVKRGFRPAETKGTLKVLGRAYAGGLWILRSLAMIGYLLVDVPLSWCGIGYTVYLLAERTEEHGAR